MLRLRVASAIALLLALIPIQVAAAAEAPAALPPGTVIHDATALPPAEAAAAAPALPSYPDHPGWPVSVLGGASPPVCFDLDPSYPGLETVVGTLSSGSNLYVFHQDGTLMSGYPISLGFFVAASPSIADINGDGLPEIVVGSMGSNKVYALRANGTVLPGWPITVGANVRSTAALADLDPSYPGLEIIVGVQDGTVQAWHADGTRVPGWPVMAGDFVERCSPAVGDVDNDGFLEVFVGSWYDYQPTSTGGVYGFDHTGAPLPGWPKLTNHVSVIASPALADLDGDGFKEIIVGTYEVNSKMYVWHHDGTPMTGWPYTIPRGMAGGSYVSSSPAVGDIDGDGNLEIVDGTCGQCGTVYAWRRDGTVVPGWPYVVNAVVDGSSPVIGDINGDGQMEIVVGSGSGFTPSGCTVGAISKAYVFHPDGTLLPGWPLDLGTATPPYPAITDLDGDGNAEVVMAYNQTVYVWDAPGAYLPNRTPWPYYHLGIDHTGDFRMNPAAVDDAQGAPSGAWRIWPNPRVGPGPVRFARAGSGVVGGIEILDSAGRIVRSLTGDSWDGADAAGRPVPGGVYFARLPGAAARVIVLP